MYYLGTVSGASGAYYNNVTGVSGVGTFAIPGSLAALYLAYGGSGLTGVSFLLSAATGVTSFINAANGAPVPAVGTIGGPYRTVLGANVTVGIYNPNGGFVSVKVWGSR